MNEERKNLSKQLMGKKVDDEDLFGYLMYPSVFLDYMGRHRTYGPVRTLPTRNFFYGMQPGEEISAEIDPGKILEIRLQAIGDPDENGEVKVFFELNGQPRVIRVKDRSKSLVRQSVSQMYQTQTIFQHLWRVLLLQ